MLNGQKLQLNFHARYELTEQLKFLIQLIEMEKEIATTHSQRNAYDHVMRVQLQNLLNRVQYAENPEETQVDSIPF